MRMIPVKNIPLLHETPLATIRIDDGELIIEVDDENEKRMKIIFCPYQAIRVITTDCFLLPEDLDQSIIIKTIVEMEESEWVKKLKYNLSEVDEGADFMDKAHHYLIPLQDDFLEVVAWDIKCEYI